MAKVILTIEDEGESLKMDIVFEPAVKRGESITPAQSAGLEIANELGPGASEESRTFSDWHREESKKPGGAERP